MTYEALNTEHIKEIALWGIVAVVIIGLFLGYMFSQIVIRIIILVVVVGIATLLWTQRNTVENHVKNCNTNISFLGQHINFSASAAKKCKQLHPTTTTNH